MSHPYLLVGLGNPGVKYQQTRHNLGFMVIDNIAAVKRSELKAERTYHTSRYLEGDKEIILAKPTTYMNRSGVPVRDLVESHSVPLEHLLVILDDLNLPFGKIRLRKKGSDGGHNGLSSVINSLRTEAFPRLRIGIGQGNLRDTVDFVLSDFNRAERKVLPDIVERATEACLSFVTDGVTQAMNKHNVNTCKEA